MDAKELYLLAVRENGIGEKEYSCLSEEEKGMLEKGADGRYRLSPSERLKFKVVLTGGVFDVLHMGHVLTLQKAKELGDLLVAVVATDSHVEKVKKRRPIHNAEYRRAMVASLKPVDAAIVGVEKIMDTFERVEPDVVAFGYDQRPMELPPGVKVVHLTDVVSDPAMAKTSRIIRELGL